MNIFMKFWLGSLGAYCPRQDTTSIFAPLISLFPTEWWQLATLETCPHFSLHVFQKDDSHDKITFLTALDLYWILLYSSTVVFLVYH